MNCKVSCITFLICISILFSCTKSNKIKDTESKYVTNYKISWKLDSSSVVLQNCTDNGIKINEQNFEGEDSRIYINKALNVGKSKILVSKDSIKKDKSSHNSRSNLKKMKILLHLDSAIGTIMKFDTLKHLFGYHYASKKFNINNFILNDIEADIVDFDQNDSVSISLNNCKIQYVNILSKGNGNFWDQLNSRKSNRRPLNLIISPFNSSAPQYISIEGKLLGNICTGKSKEINITNCSVSRNSIIFTMGLDTLNLSRLTFKNSLTRLDVSILGINEQHQDQEVAYVLPPREERSKKKMLILNDVDASQLNIDYRYFTYLPIDRDYDANIKNYEDIISSQRRVYNREGEIEASIDLAIYQDQQHYITLLVIPIKLWWNNYGYNKERVVISAFELFCLVWIVNLIIFNKVLEAYGFTEIKKQRLVAIKFSNKFRRLLFLSLLSFIYSGYLFFGLKFEINNLKLKPIWVAFWIIAQYVVGIISLAYIANIIISK